MAVSARASSWALTAATWLASAGVNGAGTPVVEAAADDDDEEEVLSGATDDAAGLAATATAPGSALALPALTSDAVGFAADDAAAVAAVEAPAALGKGLCDKIDTAVGTAEPALIGCATPGRWNIGAPGSGATTEGVAVAAPALEALVDVEAWSRVSPDASEI